MAKLIVAPKGQMKETIEQACKAHNASSLAGGLALAEGDHTLKVADKKAFGVLVVEAGDGKNWALPIVAGTVGKTTFELSEKAGASTLVIADQFITEMQAGGTYTITVSKNNKGRKVISNVVLADGVEAEEED